MFARKKRNRSGSISVQLISKEHSRYRVVQTIGSSRDPDEIERMFQYARTIAKSPGPGQAKLLPIQSQAEIAEENFAAQLSRASVRLLGPELVFGTLFDRMGFNAIPDYLFRHLVIARLAYPVSKLRRLITWSGTWANTGR